MSLKNSKLFLRNFILLFLVLFVLLNLYSLYIYQNSKQLLVNELSSYNIQNTEYIYNTFEQEIDEAKYLLSTLVINNKISTLLSSPSSPFVSLYYLEDITDMLQSLCYSNQAIETIYIYSESAHKMYRPTSGNTADYSWINDLDPDENGFSIFPYTLYGQYPYVMCIAKEVEYDGNRSVISCMLNLANIASLNELYSNNNQNFFIISDEEYIIYRYHQRDAKEPLTVSEYLSHFNSSDEQNPVIYLDNGVHYSFSQLHSANYPWTYALCTQLTEYTERLSTSRVITLTLGFISILVSVLLAILFANHSLKPIISIKQLLDRPDYFSEKDINNSEEITYIAKKIISYVQTNQQLADELDTQINFLTETRKQNLQLQINPHFLFNTLNIMYMQAVDSLGYEHTLPIMTQNLSSLLRYTLEPTYMTTLKTELHYTNIYLEIIVQRYGNNISIMQHINPEILDAKVPRLFLQPIIENAVFHGFAKQYDKECTLTLSCLPDETLSEEASTPRLILTITDDGLGMDYDTLARLQNMIDSKTFNTDESKHIGLRNVSQRLNLFFAGDAQITITSTRNTGTTFTIILPYIN